MDGVVWLGEVAAWLVALDVAAGLVLVWLPDALFMVLVEVAPSGVVAAELPAADWLLPVQESETMLTEFTCRVPLPDCVPCTSTSCPSWGFSMELSPFRVVSWPFWVRIQFPPDCFRQPRRTVSWPVCEALGVF